MFWFSQLSTIPQYPVFYVKVSCFTFSYIKRLTCWALHDWPWMKSIVNGKPYVQLRWNHYICNWRISRSTTRHHPGSNKLGAKDSSHVKLQLHTYKSTRENMNLFTVDVAYYANSGVKWCVWSLIGERENQEGWVNNSRGKRQKSPLSSSVSIWFREGRKKGSSWLAL